MSAKNLDKRGRWRNVSVGFKMSPEEAKLLDVKVAISGLSKQDYIINLLLDREINVQANPKVYIALKRQLEKVLAELQAANRYQPSYKLLETICQINRTLYGMKGKKMTALNLSARTDRDSHLCNSNYSITKFFADVKCY